jgi:hypothetical protein
VCWRTALPAAGGLRLPRNQTSGAKDTMHDEHGKLFQQGPAIELLARKLQVPIDGMTRLYENELAKLEIDARIRGFLPVLAMRKVREILELDRAGTAVHPPEAKRGAFFGTPRYSSTSTAPLAATVTMFTPVWPYLGPAIR